MEIIFFTHAFANSWAGIAFLFFLFQLFFFGTLGWGSLLGRSLFGEMNTLDNWTNSFLLGTVSLSCFVAVLGSIGALQVLPGWAWLLLAAAGNFFFRSTTWKDLFFTMRRNWPFAAFLLFLILIRALSAAVPQEHGDPLVYNLLGPRLWARHGGFYLDTNFPITLFAYPWDYLYVWPQRIFSTDLSFPALLSAHLFAQWTHFFFAYVGSFLLLLRLYRGIFSGPSKYLVAIAAILSIGLNWTAVLAKSDVGIAFWTLGALCFLLERPWSTKRLALAGVLSGIAFAGKISAAFTIFPALLFCVPAWIFQKKIEIKFVRALSVYSLGFLLMVIPLYVRNYILTGDPLFPLFTKIFPSKWVSLSWESMLSDLNPNATRGDTLALVWHYIPVAIHEAPWIVFLLVLPFVFPWPSKNARFIAFVPISGFIIYLAAAGLHLEIRYFGAGVFLLSALSAASLVWFMEKFFASWRRPVQVLFFVLLMACSKLPTHLLWRMPSMTLGEEYILMHTGGRAKAWLREHAHGDKVLMLSEDEAYYISTLNVSAVGELTPLQLEWKLATNGEQFVKGLCDKSQAHFVIDSHPGFGFAKFGPQFGADAISFQSQGVTVYDLAKLEAKFRPLEQRTCGTVKKL